MTIADLPQLELALVGRAKVPPEAFAAHTPIGQAYATLQAAAAAFALAEQQRGPVTAAPVSVSAAQLLAPAAPPLDDPELHQLGREHERAAEAFATLWRRYVYLVDTWNALLAAPAGGIWGHLPVQRWWEALGEAAAELARIEGVGAVGAPLFFACS